MSSRPWLGGVGLVAVAVAYAFLLAAVRRADRGYPSTSRTDSTWWFGYVRDATNLFAVLGFSGSLVLLGYPAPLGLLAGVLLTLVAYGLDYFLARVLGLPRAEILLSGLLVAALVPVILLPEQTAVALDELVDRLFSASTARRERG